MPRSARSLLALLTGLGILLATASCGRYGQSNEEYRVSEAFAAWKTDMLNQQPGPAMAYIPRHVDDYLAALNAGEGNAVVPGGPSQSPGVDRLLRAALAKKVPPDLRSHLTLGTLVQRISDRHLINPRDLREIGLGHVAINGDHADAAIYYDGTLTALRLPFVREDNEWKIDVMAILPYAEMLMRVDRAIKGQTETEQVDELVSRLPSL